GAERRIRQIAQLLGKVEAGEALIARFREALREVADAVAKRKKRPRVLFILAGGKRPLIVAGRGTSVAALLELAGAANVAGELDGWKPLSQEAMVAAAPEFILTNRDGLTPTADGTPIALKAPGAAATPAAREGRLVHIADRYLGGIGIHTPEGLRLLLRELDLPR
ncbi:MAG: ABC transporter substrate-binding protein, partial [Casimicrobiaceae bacterium]